MTAFVNISNAAVTSFFFFFLGGGGGGGGGLIILHLQIYSTQFTHGKNNIRRFYGKITGNQLQSICWYHDGICKH